MTRGVFIAGTDTEVGKTYVTCQLLQQVNALGIEVAGMKPVASGVEKGKKGVNQDVERIIQATGREYEGKLVNQYTFEPFIAPHLAADKVGKSISLPVITDAYRQLSKDARLVVVEGAGGLMTPLNDKCTFIDLIQDLKLEVVLVVAIRLGCINHALLTQQAMFSARIKFIGWVANYPEKNVCRDIEVENSLQNRLKAPLLGVLPFASAFSDEGKLDLKSAGIIE